MPMTARVPGKNRDIIKRQHFYELRPAPGMFVTAMKKEQRFFCRRRRKPGAVKELGAVPTRHRVLSGLHVVAPIAELPRATRSRRRRFPLCLKTSLHNCAA